MRLRRYQGRALVLGALLAGLAAVHPAGVRAGSQVQLDRTMYASSLAGLHAPAVVAGRGDNNQGDNNQGDNNQGDNGYNHSGSGTATPELDSGALTVLGIAAGVVLLASRRRRWSGRQGGERAEA
jgi:hypothetical protein